MYILIIDDLVIVSITLCNVFISNVKYIYFLDGSIMSKASLQRTDLDLMARIEGIWTQKT